MSFTAIINDTDQLLRNHINEMKNLMTNEGIQKIFDEYYKNKQEHENSAFTIFNLISEKYYYENFHSDIISVFLNRCGEHKEGNRFLYILLGLLQKIKPELKINPDDFSNTVTLRENERIDILISDLKTKKVIIIENKINNAPDTNRQLPTYVLKKGEKNIVAIIYLPLDPNKKPSKNGWYPNEESFIDLKLIRIPAFNRTETDLYNGWLLPCIKESENDDSREILKQYGKIIQKIGGLVMDNNLYNDFYELVVKEKGKLKTVLSIVEMVEQFHYHLSYRIYRRFVSEYGPFAGINFDQRNSVRFEWVTVDEVDYTMHINCMRESSDFIYRVRIWDKGFSKNGIQNTRSFIERLGYENVFSINPEDKNELYRTFKFPEEESSLYDFINEFKEKITQILG